jgi:hypothetical protein
MTQMCGTDEFQAVGLATAMSAFNGRLVRDAPEAVGHALHLQLADVYRV